MDFTQIYKQSGSLTAFSNGGHFILAAVDDRLIIRRVDSFVITRSWLIDSTPITHIGWSFDSELVFGACAKRGLVSVFKIRDENWNARIEAGAEGLAKVEWSPDGRSILCFSEWGLRVTVWSLATGSATYIQFPLHPDKGYCFRSDGRYFILAERHKSKDTIGVYDTLDSYHMVRHFPLPTSSLASILLSPTGNHLAIWEGSLEYKLYVFSLAGALQGTFMPHDDPGFGIRTAAWHPAGSLIAVAGWDDHIYILDPLTWSPVVTFHFQARVPVGVIVWKEPSNWIETTGGRGFLSYVQSTGPHSLPYTRTDLTRAKPKCGAVQLDWNKTGNLLLARFENAPSVVHIYEFPPPSLSVQVPKLRSVLINSKPITHACWNPKRKGVLALCSGGSSIYTWSDEWVGEDGKEEEIAECIGVPAKQFDTRSICWSPEGKGLILMDKDTFCCAFEVSEADEDEPMVPGDN